MVVSVGCGVGVAAGRVSVRAAGANIGLAVAVGGAVAGASLGLESGAGGVGGSSAIVTDGEIVGQREASAAGHERGGPPPLGSASSIHWRPAGVAHRARRGAACLLSSFRCPFHHALPGGGRLLSGAPRERRVAAHP